MDPKEAVREARLRLRKLAAHAEATIERLRGERTSLQDKLSLVRSQLEALSAAGRPEAEEAQNLLELLESKLSAVRLEEAGAERQRAEVQAELKELGGLLPALERAEVQRLTQSAMSPDIDERTPDQIALENVRYHLDTLEAEASLGALGSRTAEPEPETKPDPHAQLAALKAARQGSPKSEDAEPNADPAPTPVKKSKRTM